MTTALEGGKVTPRPFFTPGKDLIPIVQEAGWAPEPVWTVAEKILPPTGIRSPDRPARSQLLYHLRYYIHIHIHKYVTHNIDQYFVAETTGCAISHTNA